jgi:hypothetical protein
MPGAHVFVDPASPIFIAGNQNAARDVARTMIGMQREAKQRQITLTLSAHFGKQAGDKTTRYTRPQDRIAGSFAFSGFTDTQMYIVEPEPPETAYYEFGWNPRHLPPETFKCVRDPKTGLFIPYDEITEDGTALTVLDCLNPAGPSEITTIRERAIQQGLSRATVTRLLAKLLEDRRICKLGRGRYQRVQTH